jgi:RHS repeat-associated protein
MERNAATYQWGNSERVISKKAQWAPSGTKFVTENAFSNATLTTEMHLRNSGFDYESATANLVWTSRDPIRLRGGLNVYAYVKSNPVGAVDPSGLWAAGIGIQGELQVVLGGEVSVTLVFDSEGNIGIALEVGVRTGPMVAGGFSGTGFINFDANTIHDIAGWSGFGAVGLVGASVGGQLGYNKKGNKDQCLDGENDRSFLRIIQASAIGPDMSIGLAIGVSYTWVVKLGSLW